MTSGVNVFGPVNVASGLGTAVRSHLRAMDAAGLRSRVFPFVLSTKQGTVPFKRDAESRFFDVSVAYANADATEYFLSLFGAQFTRSRYRIGVWVWELPAANPWHLAHTRIYDEIWVPSTFNLRAFSAITRTPVHLVPYAVGMPAPGATQYRRQAGIPDDAYVFLYMFDASSYVERKNPGALLSAFAAEFRDAPSVHLVLKVSYLHADAGFAAKLRATRAALPNLHVVTEILSEADLAALIAGTDCYVSPHRTEGFGFTVAEAMLLGKPVIATDYGSTTDFLSEDTGFPVPYRFIEIGRDIGGAYLRGAVWADVMPAELARRMRFVVEQPGEARRRADTARERMRSRYSEAVIGKTIAERLAVIAARA